MSVALAVVLSVATFGLGVVTGLLLNYFIETKPLMDDYRGMVQKLYRMKKQGFVPQFKVEQPRQVDPSEEIVEY